MRHGPFKGSMDDEAAEALSTIFSAAKAVTVFSLSTGNYALKIPGGQHESLYAIASPEELLEAVRAKPAYVPRTQPSSKAMKSATTERLLAMLGKS